MFIHFVWQLFVVVYNQIANHNQRSALCPFVFAGTVRSNTFKHGIRKEIASNELFESWWWLCWTQNLFRSCCLVV